MKKNSFLELTRKKLKNYDFFVLLLININYYQKFIILLRDTTTKM